MKLYTEERYLLRKLIEESKFNLYSVYIETAFSSGQIARFVRCYTRKLYIVTIGNNVYLTPIGRYYIKKIHLFTSEEERYWKKLPDMMKNGTTCVINQVPQDIKISRKEVCKIISKKGCSRPK